jgi:predicted Kef-type K+ transport protein
LVVEFGFAEQDAVLMQRVLAAFGCFATSLVGLSMLLRFEPNSLFAPFGS